MQYFVFQPWFDKEMNTQSLWVVCPTATSIVNDCEEMGLGLCPWEYAFSLLQVVWRWNSPCMFVMINEGLDPISSVRNKYHDLNGGGLIGLIFIFFHLYIECL